MMALNVLACVLLVICAFSELLPTMKVPLASLAGLAFPFVFVLVLAFFLFWLLFARRFVWVSLLTLLICGRQVYAMCPIHVGGQNPPDGAMKVMSYNVFSRNILSSNADNDNATLQYLGRSDADIICLQECNVGGMKAFDKVSGWIGKYPYRSYLQMKNDKDAHGLVCLSKYPIVDTEMITFEHSSNAAACYYIEMGRDTLLLFNCHLQSFGLNDDDKSTYEDILSDPKDYLGANATRTLVKKLRDAGIRRAEQADIIAERVLAATAKYVMVCGDFNDSPVSYTHHVLTRSLVDAHTKSGNGFDFSYTRNRMLFRIDHLLASPNLTPYRCTVDRSIRESDHYPIAAFFVAE